jgi:hypothetical protein
MAGQTSAAPNGAVQAEVSPPPGDKDARLNDAGQAGKAAADGGDKGDDANPDFRKRREDALTRCEKKIKEYLHDATSSAWLDHTFQVVAVTLSGLTAVLILWAEVIPKPIQALPASLAAILIGIRAIFRWHDNYITARYVAATLDIEKAKYSTRSNPYGKDVSDEAALETFVTRTEAAIMDEASKWFAAHAKGVGADQ